MNNKENFKVVVSTIQFDEEVGTFGSNLRIYKEVFVCASNRDSAIDAVLDDENFLGYKFESVEKIEKTNGNL
ncbi:MULTISPECIES: hypothetical protein [Nostocales]|uniref:Uncharacterized protein n=2 Tax=Tolypothrix TaxID=111782 RepID=A0A0C1QWK9_9CYAN